MHVNSKVSSDIQYAMLCGTKIEFALISTVLIFWSPLQPSWRKEAGLMALCIVLRPEMLIKQVDTLFRQIL
jgi:hypothetical protein